MTPVRTVTPLSTALCALLLVQNLHEAAHGLLALAVGRRWLLWNLFAVRTAPGDDVSTRADLLLVAGGAALLNILCGLIAVALFSRRGLVARPVVRLFVFYLGAYSLLTGFGYLFADALAYRPDEQLGDWQQVIRLLGGGWQVRLSVLLVGAAGTLFAFFWIAYQALRFVPAPAERRSRLETLLPLLMLPYLLGNALLSLLAWWHPLGVAGFAVVLLQAWFGYSGLFWGFFIAGFWIHARPVYPDASPLPAGWRWGPLLGALTLGAASVLVLLPTLALG